MRVREFTEEELGLYNGKNGKPAYVACKGKVYDVSASFLWKNGNHQVLHNAGADLTMALEHAPHSAEAVEKFPIVGTLRSADSSTLYP